MRRFNQPTSGGNPFGNFTSLTSNNMPINGGPNNFNNAYMTVTTPFIEKQDYRNKNNFLQNNVNETLLLEQIIEYYLNIDSVDRTLAAYPNPFKFTVTFGGHGPTIDRKTFVKKNTDICGTQNESKKFSKTISYDGTPGPVINKKFKNVKYLRLDYIILPKTNIIIRENCIISNSSGASDGEFISGSGMSDINCCLSENQSDKIAYKYKYLILRINEIKSDKILGTNRNLENDVFILYPDKIMGSNHIMWLPTSGTRTYKNSILENINRLTFEILTPDGEELNIYDENNKIVNITNETNKEIIECIDKNMQINLAVVMGVIENELNTNTKFEA